MKKAILLLSLVIMSAAVSDVHAGTRINMKNGRTFVVGDCQDTKHSLICEMYGGTIELDKSDIESIEGVKYTPGSYDEGGPSEEPAATDRKPEQTEQKKPEADSTQKTGQEGREVRGLSPEQLKRLNQINDRKAALSSERDVIIQERSRLQEDVKNAGVIRDRMLFDSLKKRIADLDVRINGFNDEVNKLNAESSSLTSGK